MAAAVQLSLQGDSTDFTFDIEGTWFPRLEAEYKTAANPPQIIGLREVWEFRGCRLVGGPGAQATVTAALFVKWVALRSRVATRGSAFPTNAYLKIPGGATLHTLGPSTHEGFVIESIGGEVDPDNPAATNRQTTTMTIIVSAVQRFADTNGIVGWEQTVDSSYPDGRHRLEWRTRITTAEGTSAATKALTYAAINASTLGTTYLYETGGTAGAVDLVSSDADEQNTRTATVVEAVSRVRSYGTTIGSVTAGAAPVEVSYSVTTRSTADETSTTTSATAQGPGALQFVSGKAPATYNESEILDEQAKMFASGTWTQRVKRAKETTSVVSSAIKVTAAGGQRVVDFESVADGLEPVEFIGAYAPVTAVVEVALEHIGDPSAGGVLRLPGHPGDPWRFDALASTEGEAYVKEDATSPDKVLWGREARLVFRCAKAPSTMLGKAMARVATVDSYLYPV